LNSQTVVIVLYSFTLPLLPPPRSIAMRNGD
jgi:hypothetical protein